MSVRQLEERFAFSGGTVDRTGEYPVIRGVLLCGPESKNKRRYKAEAFAGDRVKLYEGRPVNIGHIEPRKSRHYSEQIGWIERAYHRPDGMPLGDIAVKPKHPLSETFLWDAEHRPTSAGMSHVAQCQTRSGKDGWDEVVEVHEVVSVDLVVEPATVKNLFENTSATSYRQLVEVLCKHPDSTEKQIAAAKQLREDMGGDSAAMYGSADGMDPADAICTAFESAVMAVFRDTSLDLAAKKSKIGQLLTTCDSLSNGGATESVNVSEQVKPAEVKVEEKPAEKVQPTVGQIDYPAILSECAELNYRPSALDLKALGAFSPEDRKAWLAEQKAKEPGETIKSAARKPGSSTVGTQKTTEQVNDKPVPTDGKTFAESIRVK